MAEKGPWTRDDLDEWRCPECGAMYYTHKEQGALMIKCASDHGKVLVWMQRTSAEGAGDGDEGPG